MVKTKQIGADYAFRGPVAVGDKQNPAAHGGITRIEIRVPDGATRAVNINGPHREEGPWRTSKN